MCETSSRRIFITPFQELKEFRGHRARWNHQYEVYVWWYKKTNQGETRYIPTRENFTRAIRKRGFEKKGDGKQQCLYGLVVKPAVLAEAMKGSVGGFGTTKRATRLEELPPDFEKPDV